MCSAFVDLPTSDGLGRVAEVWHDRLRLLLESTGEGIFGVDVSGACVFVNGSAARQLGWPAERILGRNMHALIHHSHPDGTHYPEAECPIFNAFRRGLPCRIADEVLWRADGTPFYAEYSSHPIVEDGTVQGAVVTFNDITERRRADELLRRTNDLLESRVAERTAELSDALTRQRELANHLELVRETERTRIAREIHDELGSLLVALKLDVHWVARRIEGQPVLQHKCDGMGRLIDTAVDNLGRIITDLRPSILDHQGLWAALEWQAQEFIETSELEADVQVHIAAGVAPPGRGPGSTPGDIGERWAIAVFRIFQEMLSNVARHAKASQLRIRLYVEEPPEATLYLEVSDDGIGAEHGAWSRPTSYGVMGMRERAAHFGGRLAIDSVPGHGTTVRLTMPLPTPDTAEKGDGGPSAGPPQAGPHPPGGSPDVPVGRGAP